MNGEKNLDILIKDMKPVLNDGNYVFCLLKKEEDISFIPRADTLCEFKEE